MLQATTLSNGKYASARPDNRTLSLKILRSCERRNKREEKKKIEKKSKRWANSIKRFIMFTISKFGIFKTLVD